MSVKVISSDQARVKWRDLMDAVVSGADIVIERYGKPTAAVIPYRDFREMEDYLEELRDIRDAQAALAEWEQNPDSFISWDIAREELLKIEQNDQE